MQRSEVGRRYDDSRAERRGGGGGDEGEDDYDRAADRKQQRRRQRRDAKASRIATHEANKRAAAERQQQSAPLAKPIPKPVRPAPVVATSRQPKGEKKKVKTLQQDTEAKQHPTSPFVPGASSCSSSAYVPPSARRGLSGSVSQDIRRVLNKLTVDSVGTLAQQLTRILQEKDISRSEVLDLTAKLLVESIRSTGTDVTPAVSLALAGLVRGLQLLFGGQTCSVLVDALRDEVRDALEADDDSTSHNCGRVLAHLYCLDGVEMQFVVDMLHDVMMHHDECGMSLALTVLRAAGKRIVAQRPVEINTMIQRLEQQGERSTRADVLLSLCKEIARGHSHVAAKTVSEDAIPLERAVSSLLPLLGEGTDTRTLKRRLSTQNTYTGTWRKHSAAKEVHGAAAPSDTESEVEDEVAAKKRRIEATRSHDKALSGQRLATEAKRQVFECIASATDDIELFQMLVNRDPTGSQAQDCFQVLLQCCCQEATYNPSYASVLQRLVASKKQHKNTLQFALWDKFKGIRLDPVDVPGYVNLAALLTTLIEHEVYHMAVLRGLDLDHTSKTIGLFARILLLRLLAALPERRLLAFFFGGTGTSAFDLSSDTSALRKCLTQFFQKYFVDQREAATWLPLFFDVIALGTALGAAPDAPELLLTRIHVVDRALREGLS